MAASGPVYLDECPGAVPLSHKTGPRRETGTPQEREAYKGRRLFEVGPGRETRGPRRGRRFNVAVSVGRFAFRIPYPVGSLRRQLAYQGVAVCQPLLTYGRPISLPYITSAQPSDIRRSRGCTAVPATAALTQRRHGNPGRTPRAARRPVPTESVRSDPLSRPGVLRSAASWGPAAMKPPPSGRSPGGSSRTRSPTPRPGSTAAPPPP